MRYLLFLTVLMLPASALASITETNRYDTDLNTTSPFLYAKQPIHISGTLVTSDECEGVGERWRIMDNAGSDVEILSGVGDAGIAGDITFSEGTHQPHVYYFLDVEGYDGELIDACSDADVFDPFEILAPDEEIATTTPDTSLPYKDAMFVYGVIIFLLAYPVWVRIFGSL